MLPAVHRRGQVPRGHHGTHEECPQVLSKVSDSLSFTTHTHTPARIPSPSQPGEDARGGWVGIFVYALFRLLQFVRSLPCCCGCPAGIAAVPCFISSFLQNFLIMPVCLRCTLCQAPHVPPPFPPPPPAHQFTAPRPPEETCRRT